MSKNIRWTDKDLRDKRLVETKDGFVPIDSVTAKGKIDKLPNLLERAIPWKEVTPSAYDGNKLPYLGLDPADWRGVKMPHDNGATEPIQPVTATKNKKVRNATKVILPDGTKADSKLEGYLYTELQAAGIEFEFQKTFVLQPKFKYRGETIRSIRSIVDFYLPKLNKIIDAKGFSNEVSPIKYKLLKYRLAKHYEKNGLGEPPEILMPSTKKSINELILKLKHG